MDSTADDSLTQEVQILVDSRHEFDLSMHEETSNIILEYFDREFSLWWNLHHLNKNYGEHKNYGNSKCDGDWIFQIDADELPPESLLGVNLKAIIESNPEVELYYVPRINDFKGVTQEHANQWGWKLEPSPFLSGRPKAAWPDYQGRIYKNVPDRIKWKNRLHETITGHNQFAMLPAEEEYALYHDKTIEGQIDNNLRYNKEFTEAENRGISAKK
jgi:glycosyltransferase involved in cell wall biosynthesis